MKIDTSLQIILVDNVNLMEKSFMKANSIQ